MEFLRGEGSSVDPVLSNAAAHHDDPVPHANLLLVGGAAGDLSGHHSRGTTVNEGFAEEPCVENYRTVNSGDTTLVAAVLDPFHDPFVDPPWMENAGRQGITVERRRKTEDIGVKEEIRPQPCTEGVPVDADNTGKRTAVGVKS